MSNRPLTHTYASGARKTIKNVHMSVEGDILTIKVDLSKNFGPSASGRSTIIATTAGNIYIPNRAEQIGLNVYKYRGNY